MKKTEEKKQKHKEEIRSKKIKRIIFYTFVFLLFLIAGIVLLRKSLFFETEKVVKYTEKSNLDYKVYLHENEFYEQEYLGKDMLYVASLIDKILIDFDYNFEGEDKESIDFNYNIIATLSINNSTGTKSYFKKSYVLLEDKIINMIDSTSQSIKETVDIDYQYYNSIANGFKNQYGVDSESKLTIYMVINKKNTENSNFALDNIKTMNVEIPLSERAVDIRLDYKDINETSSIIKKEGITFKDILPIVLAVIFIIISIVMMIKAMNNISYFRTKKSEYDKYISKVLKEYDRLIAESSTLLSFEGKDVISITKFTELLDIHDNLQLPIMYYEVEKHNQCYFYINKDNTVYILEVNVNNLNNVK